MLLVSGRAHRVAQRQFRPRALLVQSSSNPDGSAFSGLLVARAILSLGYELHVAFRVPGPMCDRYEQIGCLVHVVPHENWLASHSARGFVKALLRLTRGAYLFGRLIRRLEPAFVYVNTIVSTPAALAARAQRSPVILHIRELFEEAGGEMCWPWVGGRHLVRSVVLGVADRVVVPSHAVLANVLGDSTASCRLVPNAVDARFFGMSDADRADCRRRLGVPDDGCFIIGVPGTLRPVKGHPFFLEAAARVGALDPGIRFVIAGEAPVSAYGDFVRSEIVRHGLGSRVYLPGSVPDMRDFYGACDIVCVPSRSESFGRCVIEAFASGRPVVATAVSGITEIIQHEQTGLLVPYGDVNAMANTLINLRRDAAFRQQLASRARVIAVERYHECKYTRQLTGLIQSLVTKRSSSSAIRSGHVE